MVDYPVQRRDEFDVTVADSLRRDNPLASMVGEVRRSNGMTLGQLASTRASQKNKIQFLQMGQSQSHKFGVWRIGATNLAYRINHLPDNPPQNWRGGLLLIGGN